MEFTKVKYDGEKVELEFEKYGPADHPETHKIKAEDPPMPSLDDALQKLKGHALRSIGLTGLYQRTPAGETVEFDFGENSRVQSVTVTEGEGGLEATVTIIKNLPEKGTKLNLHTPKARASEAMLDVIDELWIEAEKYIDGRRAQLDAFGDDNSYVMN